MGIRRGHGRRSAPAPRRAGPGARSLPDETISE
jgi:hypothetical protein